MIRCLETHSAGEDERHWGCSVQRNTGGDKVQVVKDVLYKVTKEIVLLIYHMKW